MEILLWIIIILSMFLAFSIGSQDQTFATTIGSGALKIKHAVILGSILAFFGTLFLSSSVGKTIGKNLLGPAVQYTLPLVISIIFSTGLWIFISSLKGIPISTTHTVVGSVVGIGIIHSILNYTSFAEALNWVGIGRVALGWVLSPLFGYIGAALITFSVKKLMARYNTGFIRLEKGERQFGKAIIGFTCLNQISRAGNDSANSLAILFSLSQTGQFSEENLSTMIGVIALCYMVGLFLIARRVIENVGYSTGDLRPSEAVSVEASSAIVMFVCTILGLPVSGTHISVFSLFGNARMRGEQPDRRSLIKMVITWVITFPVAAIVSGIVYFIVLNAIAFLG
jgi:PiT family inorganic phosphate transporter